MEKVSVFFSYFYVASASLLVNGDIWGMQLNRHYHFFTAKDYSHILNQFLWIVVLCRLRPSTQKVLSLAAEVKTLEKDKEHLRMNLSKAEEEVRTKNFGHWMLVEICISLFRT